MEDVEDMDGPISGTVLVSGESGGEADDVSLALLPPKLSHDVDRETSVADEDLDDEVHAAQRVFEEDHVEGCSLSLPLTRFRSSSSHRTVLRRISRRSSRTRELRFRRSR